MTGYVALLRGINVGPTTRLPMQDLRRLLEEIGGTSVRTHLQSGNALFEHERAHPAELADALETAVAAAFDGRRVPCVVREAAGLAGVVERNPFDMTGVDPARFLVTFLSGPVEADRLAGLDPAGFAPDEFRPGEREIYVHCPNGVQKTRLSHALWEKRLGLTATARNWNTVTRLAAMAAE
ncbi:DUF1697 domain-containing protein [Actinacidiphila glaucinigra]|uniref:DUF1697 domain-containing protein n=1 Tax=Actinacidiphila glaucinigra TaxID=235986 RepID=UPI002E378AFD|nr:DUF1697 domain-containing protein [Actinacidiphila glaucinigra]